MSCFVALGVSCAGTGYPGHSGVAGFAGVNESCTNGSGSVATVILAPHPGQYFAAWFNSAPQLIQYRIIITPYIIAAVL